MRRGREEDCQPIFEIDLPKQKVSDEDVRRLAGFIDKRKSNEQNDMFSREVRRMRARVDRIKSLDQKQFEYFRIRQQRNVAQTGDAPSSRKQQMRGAARNFDTIKNKIFQLTEKRQVDFELMKTQQRQDLNEQTVTERQDTVRKRSESGTSTFSEVSKRTMKKVRSIRDRLLDNSIEKDQLKNEYIKMGDLQQKLNKYEIVSLEKISEIKKLNNFINFNEAVADRTEFLRTQGAKHLRSQSHKQLAQAPGKDDESTVQPRDVEQYDDYYYDRAHGAMMRAVSREEKKRFCQFLQNPVLNSYIITRRSDLVDVKNVVEEIENLKTQEIVKEKTRQKFLEKVVPGNENWGKFEQATLTRPVTSHPQLDRKSSKKKVAVSKLLETEGDVEENAQTLDGKIFLEKYGYLTENEKMNNQFRRQQTRVKLNIPGQIIENLKLFDEDGKEIGKRNPFKRINPIKKKALRYQIKEYSRKIVRTGLRYQDIIKYKIFFSSSYEKPGSYMFMKYVKIGAFSQVQLMLKKDPYFIYSYDELKLTPIHWAVRNNDEKMTQLLLKHNTDLDELDEAGRTPLYLAYENKNIQLIKILFRNRAKPWVQRGRMLKTLEMTHEMRKAYRTAVAIQMLLHLGVRLNEKAYKVFDNEKIPDIFN